MITYILQRLVLAPTYAMGEMIISDAHWSDTLEDTVRERHNSDGTWYWSGALKVPKQTAIPSGIYQLIVDFSNRFQKDMPHVLNVPDFDGIRIHGGVTVANTEGCPMVGKAVSGGVLSNGIATSQAFLARLIADLKTDKVWLDVRNP